MDDIFKDIEVAAEKDKESIKIDFEPLKPLIKKQKTLERPADDERVWWLVRELRLNNVPIADIEEALKIIKKDLYNVKQVQIPEFMKGLNLESFKTEGGIILTIKKGVSTTVKDKDKFHEFVRSRESGDLIKTKIEVEFETDVIEEEMPKLMKFLNDINCFFEKKEGIHGNTIKKFVKDCLKNGVNIPKEAASIYEYEYAEIKEKP